MILLKKLQLNNFLSHERTIIEFLKDEKALIDGQSGSGKSSIFDGIIWALYGQSRSDNRSLIKRGAKKTTVILELEKEEESVIITRETTLAGKHTVTVLTQSSDGQRKLLPLAGIRETQEWIEKELIGASYLLFVNSVAYIQGNPYSLVSQTATKRKELLLEIIKTENLKEYYEKAKIKLQSLQNEENSKREQIIALEAQIPHLEAKIHQKEAYLDSIKTYQELLTKTTLSKKELEKTREQYLINKSTVNLLNNSIRQAEIDKNSLEIKIGSKQDLDRITLKRELLDCITKEKELREDFDKNEKQRSKIQEINALLSTTKKDAWEEEINQYQKRIKEIAHKPVCPSGEECPYSGNHNALITSLSDQILENRKKIEKEEIQMEALKKEKEGIPVPVELNILTSRINALNQRIFEIQNQLASLDEVVELKKEQEQKIIEINKYLEQKKEAEKFVLEYDITQINEDLIAISVKETEYVTNLVQSKTNLREANIAEEDLKTISLKISEINVKDIESIQKQIQEVSLIKDAFGSKGIETVVIDWLLPKLEDKINNILLKLSDFRIRLDTQHASADGKNVVEGLFITIINESGFEMDYDNYSGGEKMKITIAISEAFASLHKKIGFRLMDEAIFGLSPEMVQDFIKILLMLEIQYPQFLCISHLLEVKSIFDKSFIVNKKQGTSFIE